VAADQLSDHGKFQSTCASEDADLSSSMRSPSDRVFKLLQFVGKDVDRKLLGLVQQLEEP
jgi:hypothetical protein